MTPRHIVLASLATIVANMYMLDNEMQLSIAFDDISQDLLGGEAMPRDLLDEYADTLAKAVDDLAPAFQSLLGHAARHAEPPTLKQLPQDTEAEALTMPPIKGEN